MALDYMENDYFVKGMEIAVRKAEAAGFMLPPMDFEKYARPKEDPTEESYEDSHAATELGSEVLGGFPVSYAFKLGFPTLTRYSAGRRDSRPE